MRTYESINDHQCKAQVNLHVTIIYQVWVKIGYPKNWMVQVFNFDPSSEDL